jgi:hypothetical protein
MVVVREQERRSKSRLESDAMTDRAQPGTHPFGALALKWNMITCIISIGAKLEQASISGSGSLVGRSTVQVQPPRPQPLVPSYSRPSFYHHGQTLDFCTTYPCADGPVRCFAVRAARLPPDYLKRQMVMEGLRCVLAFSAVCNLADSTCIQANPPTQCISGPLIYHRIHQFRVRISL